MKTFISRAKIQLQINKNQDIAIISKYEDRWRKMEKNIYDITMINNEQSESLHVSDNFDFKNISATSDALSELNGVIKRFEDGFIHIERVYNVENKSAVVFRISMGSFDRPEHLYAIIDGEQTRYFPKTPLRSSANLAAHKILNEMLHG